MAGGDAKVLNPPLVERGGGVEELCYQADGSILRGKNLLCSTVDPRYSKGKLHN